MPDTDLISQFCLHLLAEKRYSTHTASNYQADLTDFKDYLATTYFMEPGQAEPQMIRSWLAALKSQKFEPSSINRKISAVRSFYKYLQKKQLIERNPASAVHSLKQRKRLPSFVEENQILPVLERAFFPGGFEGSTHFLAVTLLYVTGIRVSELANIKDQDIDFSGGVIRIIGKGNKQRNVPLNGETMGQIQSYISERNKQVETTSDFLLVNQKGRPLSRSMIYRIVKGTLGEVTTLKKKSPHVLRHSFATHLSNHGAGINEIKELLGHASLASTQVYTHTAVARLIEIHKKAHPKG